MGRMHQNKKTVKRILSLILTAAALTACGGNQSAPETKGSTAAGKADTGMEATTETAESAGDGVLDVGYATGPESLVPFRSEITCDMPCMNLLYEALAVIDSEQELTPWIAVSWETQDNGFTYDIEIQENITDSQGNPITAEDIVWFIETAKEEAMKPVYSKVESVTLTDENSLQLKLTSNIVGTFEKIMTGTYAVSRKSYEASSDGFSSSLASSSPYKVTEFTANSIITFERRDDYWQDVNLLPECVRPQVEKISFHAIPEASQMGIALETGVIDVALRVDSSTGAQFAGNTDYTVELSEGTQGWTLCFSGAENSLLAENEKLRQAICYAIDVDGLITGLCAGYGTYMYDSHSAVMIGYNPKWEQEEYYPYDVEKAKSLLAESGYNGETISLLSISTTLPQRLSQMIQNYLAAVGINVELNIVDKALFTATRLDGSQYDMVLMTIGGTYLSDAWSIRYDPDAYSTGDATSRRDYDLQALLHEAWTPEGWTEENIDAVHNYLRDHAISYGMVNPQNMAIWRNDIGLEKEVKEVAGYIAPAASTYSGL